MLHFFLSPWVYYPTIVFYIAYSYFTYRWWWTNFPETAMILRPVVERRILSFFTWSVFITLFLAFIPIVNVIALVFSLVTHIPLARFMRKNDAQIAAFLRKRKNA